MQNWLIAGGIFTVHWLIVGIVYGSLPKNWKSPYTYIDDNANRFGASFFWPIAVPMFAGAALVRFVRARRVARTLPQARTVQR